MKPGVAIGVGAVVALLGACAPPRSAKHDGAGGGNAGGSGGGGSGGAPGDGPSPDVGDSAAADRAPDAAPAGNWVSRTASPLPASWPEARQYAAMVYDSERGRVLLFGGNGDKDMLRDTWEWNGAAGTWANRTPSTLPASWPPGRATHALAYDSDRRKAVLFGGRSESATLQDTWEWDGTAGTWTDHTGSPPPASWPPARWWPALAYEADRRRVVLFGGFGGPNLDDTWEWDGAAGTWTNRTPSPPPASWPDARHNHAMVYDGARKQVFLFGGAGDWNYQDVWEWDGTAGTWANRMPSVVWPAPRQGHAIGGDAKRGKIVLFGGGDSPVQFQDTWEWDGAAGAWVDRTASPLPASWPSKRFGHAMAFDAGRGKVVMFGGGPTSMVKLRDTWEWDGSP